METAQSRRLMSWAAVKSRTGGFSKATEWRMRRRGEFPNPVKISPGRVAWFEDEIEAWIESRTTTRAA